MSINVLAFFNHCLCSKFILFLSWAMLAFLVGGVIDFSERDGTSPLMSQLYVAASSHFSVLSRVANGLEDRDTGEVYTSRRRVCSKKRW